MHPAGCIIILCSTRPGAASIYNIMLHQAGCVIIKLFRTTPSVDVLEGLANSAAISDKNTTFACTYDKFSLNA